ncbi:nuclear nucleic acid-binding protein C1D [Acanthochromis polyacanthus]|uniref:Nuclear nucleic acid-binding protein C1D n=1 Tax=Acanthochromis polyacanthus TaxID=80966 RepID=A0A3Q1EJB1_9TELE|nr:nuclear nucleic acid-binding protein C1D [Acanthochromis polyacanthus]XP_022057489.1 nuclear nucleic acid-binding protein C1D [Acanthochromis polyacanthus]XP_022057490.1 nuclear nucleic acid-binding protein C1D [Acanthochromis polyacanthus]
MAAEINTEDYPQEIDEQLTGFDSSVTEVKTMLEKLMAMNRNDLQQKLDPLDQAKLDLMSAYTLNSLFWMYLVTQGVNPREHGIKQELERIRTYMNRVKEITDKKKAARLDKGAAARFVRNALYDAEDKDSKKKVASRRAADTTSESPQPKRPKQN